MFQKIIPQPVQILYYEIFNDYFKNAKGFLYVMIDGEKMISPITQMKNHCSKIHTEIVVIIELLNNEAKKNHPQRKKNKFARTLR